KHVRPAVKVLLSSGYNEVEATRRFEGEGLAGFIQKPYTAAALDVKINDISRNGRIRHDFFWASHMGAPAQALTSDAMDELSIEIRKRLLAATAWQEALSEYAKAT